jgi:hypothetical protein
LRGRGWTSTDLIDQEEISHVLPKSSQLKKIAQEIEPTARLAFRARTSGRFWLFLLPVALHLRLLRAVSLEPGIAPCFLGDLKRVPVCAAQGAGTVRTNSPKVNSDPITSKL